MLNHHVAVGDGGDDAADDFQRDNHPRCRHSLCDGDDCCSDLSSAAAADGPSYKYPWQTASPHQCIRYLLQHSSACRRRLRRHDHPYRDAAAADDDDCDCDDYDYPRRVSYVHCFPCSRSRPETRYSLRPGSHWEYRSAGYHLHSAAAAAAADQVRRCGFVFGPEYRSGRKIWRQRRRQRLQLLPCLFDGHGLAS